VFVVGVQLAGASGVSSENSAIERFILHYVKKTI